MIKHVTIALATLTLLFGSMGQVKAGIIVYTAANSGFVADSAADSPAYLAAQGSPTEFLSFSTDKNGNLIFATNNPVAGNIFSNNVLFSTNVGSFGGTNSANVELGNSPTASSEIGPVGTYTGILNIDFLADGQTARAVGFGLVEPNEFVRVFDQNNILVYSSQNNFGNTFEFQGFVGTGGTSIGRVELDGSFFAIQDLQFSLGGANSPAVPEPATLTMLGFGVVSLVGYGWRRRKQAARVAG